MTSFENLNTQSHKITELSNVVKALIQERLLCDSETCTNLLFEYLDHVAQHIQEIDSTMYADLLKHSSKENNNIAKNFLSGSQEIKRIIKRYQKRWCNKKAVCLNIGPNHNTFLHETEDMFIMVLKRLQDEMEHLYPAVRKITEQ